MSKCAIQPLSATTWNAFVQLAEKHNGVWGGCWCTWFHPPRAELGSETRRDYKERLVREGNAHKRTSGSFLYNGTRSLFEQAGFTYDRPRGKATR